MTVDFGEAVTGFVVGDVTVSGGTKSNFSGADGRFPLHADGDAGRQRRAHGLRGRGRRRRPRGQRQHRGRRPDRELWGGTPAPQAFSWQATLEVEGSSSWYGYCVQPCPVYGAQWRTVGPRHAERRRHGHRLHAFPDRGSEVEVTALDPALREQAAPGAVDVRGGGPCTGRGRWTGTASSRSRSPAVTV